MAALEAADTTKVRRRAGRPLVIGGDMVGASATTTRTDSATAIQAQPWSARSLSHWRGAHQGTRPGLQQHIVLHGGEPLEGEEPHTALAERGHHVGDAERRAHGTEVVAVLLVQRPEERPNADLLRDGDRVAAPGHEGRLVCADERGQREGRVHVLGEGAPGGLHPVEARGGHHYFLKLKGPGKRGLGGGRLDCSTIGLNKGLPKRKEGALECCSHVMEHHEVGDREAGLDEAEGRVMGTPLVGFASSGTRKRAHNVGVERDVGDEGAPLEPGRFFLGLLGAEGVIAGAIRHAATIALEVGQHVHTVALRSSRRLVVDDCLPSATIFRIL